MKKTIDKAISLLIVCCIMVSQCLVICSAQEINAPVFRLIDEAHGIYQRVNQSRSSNSNDDKLIRYNGQYYIQLEDTLYAQAQRLVFTSSSSLTSLKPETQNVVRSVFNWANANGTDLVGGTVEVFTPINEELISQSSVFASDFPVTNEQVRYVAVGNEQVIASGNNTFQTYASTVLNNAADAIIQGIVSALSPFMGNILTVAGLFPSKYNEVKSYTDWTFGIKLHEEKVVQLSWVYVANSPYLGAQTQFTTIIYDSLLAATLHPSIMDNSGYLYYKTPNYDRPEDIARQNFTSTWVERISAYDIAGVKVSSLS